MPTDILLMIAALLLLLGGGVMVARHRDRRSRATDPTHIKGRRRR